MINKDQLKARLDAPRIQSLQSSNKRSLPSNWQMAKNLGSSVVRNIKSVAAGNNLKISDLDAQNRLKICQGCEFFESAANRCRKCGCFMSVKTYLKAERCPVGKW